MKTILFLDCDQKERAPDPRLQCVNHIWSSPPVLHALLPFLLYRKGELGMVIIFGGIAAAQQSSPFTEAGGRVLGEESIIHCFLGESL